MILACNHLKACIRQFFDEVGLNMELCIHVNRLTFKDGVNDDGTTYLYLDRFRMFFSHFFSFVFTHTR